MRINYPLAIVIPTFRRSGLLMALLSDLFKQTKLPGKIIVVDGDPSDEGTKSVLRKGVTTAPCQIIYIPSNHANAPYQRYLGALAASDSQWLVFFDDDLRLHQTDAIDKLIAPLCWEDRRVVGISPRITFPSRQHISQQHWSKTTRLKKWLGASRKQPSGGLSPTGNRISPVDQGEPYTRVQWLYGGVMAYSTSQLLGEIYMPDAFAMSELGFGLGVDDTILSRYVGNHGELLMAFCAEVEHPDLDQSRVSPAKAQKRGLAYAYSRRFINDHFRVFGSPLFSDRLSLIQTYFGNLVLNWAIALKEHNSERTEYAIGYTQGIIKAILVDPTARNLTPSIDWQQDGKIALSLMEVVHAPVALV